MKRFAFRLEPILRLKAHREKEKQKNHAVAVQQVIQQEQNLADLAQNRRERQEELRSYLTGRLDVSHLKAFNRFFIKLKKDEIAGKELLGAYRKNAEQKRAELVEASRERKTYDKLKERQFEKFKKEYLSALQKEQDEIALQVTRHKKTPA